MARLPETPADSAIVQLVESPFFVMKHRTLRAGSHHQIVSTGPLILIMLEGEAFLKHPTTKKHVRSQRGQTVLLPASLRSTTAEILTDCQLLEVTIPETGYNPLQ